MAKAKHQKTTEATGASAALRPQPREEMLASAPTVDVALPAAQIDLPDKTGPPSLASDLLIGASAISHFLYGTANRRRQIYHLVEKGALPTFRLAGLLAARKTTLEKFFEAQERAALAHLGGKSS